MAIYILGLPELLFIHIVFIYLELQSFGGISCWESAVGKSASS